MPHTTENNDLIKARIKRLIGQMQGVDRALDAKAGCSEILQQVAAVRGAVNGLMDTIIEDHLRQHVARPDLDETARARGADELIAVIRRYSK